MPPEPFPNTAAAHVEAGISGWYDARNDLVHAVGLAAVEGLIDQATRLRVHILAMDSIVDDLSSIFGIKCPPDPHGDGGLPRG